MGPPTLDDGTFVGHASDRTIQIQFNLYITTAVTAYVEGLNLYFYSIPTRRIGLPYNIRIISPSRSGDHSYQLEGNEDLTVDDNGRRSVTLIPEALSTMSTFTIIFEFSNTEQIDWLLLTEVEICTSGSCRYMQVQVTMYLSHLSTPSSCKPPQPSSIPPSPSPRTLWGPSPHPPSTPHSA